MKDCSARTIFAPNEFWRIVIVVTILTCGFVTRLYDLTDPPLDYAGSRQLRSMMIARGKYYAQLDDAPPWKQDSAKKQSEIHGTLEPEVIETITAFTYRIVGGEYGWIARIYSSFFWVLAGLALYHLIRDMVSEDGAVIALIYYLFVPFGLLASRTFQPDPLMSALIVTSWLTFYTWYQKPSWKRAIFAGLVAGAALFVKSNSAFYLFFGMAFVLLYKSNIHSLIKDAQIWLIGLLSGLPAITYIIYGIFITGELENQLKGRFLPQMWSDPGFYSKWVEVLSSVAGHWMILLIGFVGLFLVQSKQDQILLSGIWFGYIIYGFIFSYYISTHKYYTLPIIPLLGITIGVIFERGKQYIWKEQLKWLIRIGSTVIVILGIAGGYYIYHRNDFRHEPSYYSKVASYIPRDSNVIALSQDYGYRLSYYGWLAVHNWKGTEDLRYSEIQKEEIDYFGNNFREFSKKYDYFVITRMKEFRRQEELFVELNNHYPIVRQGGGYVIFNLQERID